MKALAFDNHPLAYRDLDEDRQVVQDARAMMREEAEAIMALSQRIDARFDGGSLPGSASQVISVARSRRPLPRQARPRSSFTQRRPRTVISA